MFDIEREDLTIFLNACAVATGQNEFYSSDMPQQVSLNFLHEYICGNYRELYVQCLATGVNHFNQAEIIFHLLSSGKNCNPDNRKEENALITAALDKLPPQRGWKLIERLKKARVNNRRTRKLIHRFIERRKDLSFDSIKYRRKLKAAVQHSHLKLSGEIPDFLFKGLKNRFEDPLLERYRKAHYSKEAVYELPYSVAEGFVSKHKIPREEFLDKIQSKMTERERLRIQEGSKSKVKLNPEKLSLTELCVYILSLNIVDRKKRDDEIKGWMKKACGATLKKLGPLPVPGDKIASVLDNSYSSSGSRQKRNRPLAVAMASHMILEESLDNYKPFWTYPNTEYLHPRGQTFLTERVLDALEWGADTVIIVSDGCENDVAGAAREIFKAYKSGGGKASIIHLNPVFDPETYQVRSLAKEVPAIGLRTGEDLATSLLFARFSCGDSTLDQLKGYMQKKVDLMLKHHGDRS